MGGTPFGGAASLANSADQKITLRYRPDAIVSNAITYTHQTYT
ncbi:hypothetical protein [Moorena sp. SIO4G3]|nr:hypothetical protein [Moorena sp. SIO4G3]